MGQYYQQPPPGYGPQPYGAGPPPEAGSIKSMVNIASIFGILFALLFLLVLLWGIWVVATVSTYVDYWGNEISMGVGAFTWFYVIFGLLGMIFGILFFMQCRGISAMVDRGQYEQAKSKTLVWMIIGILFVGLIPGILLLIAYLKFDPLINATRAHAYGAQPPGYGAPPPQQYQQPPPQQHYAPPPQQHPPQHPARFCQGCGRQIPPNHHSCPNCGKPA